MQIEQTETIWIWFDFGVVLPRMTTYLPVPGGDSPRSTIERAMDGSMGGIDAQGRGQPADVMAARVLWVALMTAHRRGGLALC